MTLHHMKLLILVFFFCACAQEAKKTSDKSAELNPPAQGFNQEESDEKAIKIADQIMEAMGGREQYDKTTHLSWNFFGSRKHWWNKSTGDIRIESQKDSFNLIMNIHSLEGQVYKDGEYLANPDSLSKYLQLGKEMWINDSYWLVMPFKLKDSGVTLKYFGDGSVDSIEYDVLSLEFENVGVTPDNKYHVQVDRESKLITSWSFFRDREDKAPNFTTPWANYREYNGILLSDDRGQYKLTEISTERFDDKLLREL